MPEQLTDKVSFEFIRYANCWEDAIVLLDGLNLAPGKKILSIGSAGDNSFSLLTTNPELVVAIDINKTQLHLIELKKVCFENLSHAEMIAFLGYRPATNRLETFNKLKVFIGQEAQVYWDNNLQQIESGIVNQGKFEKYFQLFSHKILPWIHSKKTVEKLLSPKSAEEQAKFYNSTWNSWRWRLLFKIFFSKYVMGKYGRDPQFLKEVKIPVGETILKQTALHLSSVQAQNNFILRYNLTGSFGELLPHYLQADNFSLIQKNMHKLQIRAGFAENAIQEFGNFDAMNMSNIFEYMDDQLFIETASKLVESVNKNGRIAYWNLMVPRKISDILPEKTAYLQELSLQLSKTDNGFFYNQFIVDEKL